VRAGRRRAAGPAGGPGGLVAERGGRAGRPGVRRVAGKAVLHVD
jgi:hypothetical protein